MRRSARSGAYAGTILALALSLSACGQISFGDDEKGATGTDISASGETLTRSYPLTGFTGVVAAGPDSIIVRRGAAFSVTASGDKALLDRLVLSVDGDKLEIRRQSDFSWSGDGATVTVTLPVLTSLVIAGSGDVTADTLTGDAADVVVAGSGDATVTGIAARKLDLNIAGSGNITASGTATEVESAIAGSGDISAPALTATTAEISIIGSGGVTMAVTGTADVSTAGSGDVTLTGGATCTSSKMGSGEVTCS